MLPSEPNSEHLPAQPARPTREQRLQALQRRLQQNRNTTDRCSLKPREIF